MHSAQCTVVCVRIAHSVVGGAGGMLPQENFDMRVFLRPSETAITTHLYGNWSVTQVSHRMVVSQTPFPSESSALPQKLSLGSCRFERYIFF